MIERIGESNQSTYTTMVEWSDTDASGHYHNSSILRWVEACEVRLFRSLDVLEWYPRMPRVQHVVNYTSKLWFGQEITVRVWVRQLGRTSLTLEFEVYGGAFDGAPESRAAHGTVTIVYVPDGATGGEPWPAEFRARVNATEPAVAV